MGDWISKDGDGRWHVDLHALPRWLSLTIAAVTVAIVVSLARRFDPAPTIPTWLPRAVNVGAWIITGSLVFLCIRWLAVRKQRRTQSLRRPSNPTPPTAS